MSRLAIPAIVKHSRRQSDEITGGLDADLKARENAKRDGGLEADCVAFLVALTGAEINDMMTDLKVSPFPPHTLLFLPRIRTFCIPCRRSQLWLSTERS